MVNYRTKEGGLIDDREEPDPDLMITGKFEIDKVAYQFKG